MFDTNICVNVPRFNICKSAGIELTGKLGKRRIHSLKQKLHSITTRSRTALTIFILHDKEPRPKHITYNIIDMSYISIYIRANDDFVIYF